MKVETKPVKTFLIKLWDQNETCVWKEWVIAKDEAAAIVKAKKNFIASVAGTVAEDDGYSRATQK